MPEERKKESRGRVKVPLPADGPRFPEGFDHTLLHGIAEQHWQEMIAAYESSVEVQAEAKKAQAFLEAARPHALDGAMLMRGSTSHEHMVEIRAAIAAALEGEHPETVRLATEHLDRVQPHVTARLEQEAQRAELVREMIAAGEPMPEVPSATDLLVMEGLSEEEAIARAREAAALRAEYIRQTTEGERAPDAPPALEEPPLEILPDEEDPETEQRREYVRYMLDNQAPEPLVPSITEVTATGRDITQAGIIVRDQKLLLEEYRREKARREALEVAKKQSPGSLE